jgi:sRNA-binding regulator protein Hfq
MRFERPPFRNRPNPRGKNNGAGNHGGGNQGGGNGMRVNAPARPAEFDPGMDVEDEEDIYSEPGAKREAEYLKQLAEDHTPVVVQLNNGDRFKGFIEYYDRRFIRLTRTGQPNLFVFKQDIKYLMEE